MGHLGLGSYRLPKVLENISELEKPSFVIASGSEMSQIYERVSAIIANPHDLEQRLGDFADNLEGSSSRGAVRTCLCLAVFYDQFEKGHGFQVLGNLFRNQGSPLAQKLEATPSFLHVIRFLCKVSCYSV